ncbi:MAG: response regulator [bacterium]
MKRKTILVVDDDRSMRKGLAYELADLGYEVTEARDGSEAIELIQTNHFDLVISDLVMPKTSGLELYQVIQKINPEIKFISMTAFTESKEAKEVARILKNNFFAKPFDSDLFKKRVADLLFE